MSPEQLVELLNLALKAEKGIPEGMEFLEISFDTIPFKVMVKPIEGMGLIEYSEIYSSIFHRFVSFNWYNFPSKLMVKVFGNLYKKVPFFIKFTRAKVNLNFHNLYPQNN
jgi:hypothetical protein